MSSKRFAYIAVAVLFFVSLGMAHAQVEVRATIPFDFVASGKTMPAGTYTFRQALPNNNTELAAGDGRGHGVLISAPTLEVSETGSNLLFRKHGDTYFLADIFSDSGHLHFKEDRTESKLEQSAAVETISIPMGD